jgi:hypothetical protein
MALDEHLGGLWFIFPGAPDRARCRRQTQPQAHGKPSLAAVIARINETILAI